MNRCAKCETTFSKWSDYYAHTTGVNCVKVIKPINTSGRTKEQIVRDFEKQHEQHISTYEDVTAHMYVIPTKGQN